MAINYDPKRQLGQCNCVYYDHKFTYEVVGCDPFGTPFTNWTTEETGIVVAPGPLSMYTQRNNSDCTGAEYRVFGTNADCTPSDNVSGFTVSSGNVRNASMVVLGRTDGLPDDCGLPSPDIKLPNNSFILLPCFGGWSGCDVTVPPGSPLVPGVDPSTGRPTLTLPDGAGGLLPPGGAPFTVGEVGGPGSYSGTVGPSGGPPPNTPPGRIPGSLPPGDGPGTASDTSPGSKTITWTGTIPDGADQIIDGTQPVSYTVTYDDGTQITVPLNVDTVGGSPIVYRDNTTIAVDWTGTNTISVFTTVGEVYYVGQPYISVYSSPLFTQGSLADLKRLKHLLVFMDNTKGMDVYLPGDERVDGVRGKARQEMNCNFTIIYNNELDGSNYSSTYDYNSIFWEEPLYVNHVTAKQMNNYVMLKEPLIGYGYGYQLVVWNVDGATWTLAGYQIDAPTKGKKYLNTNE